MDEKLRVFKDGNQFVVTFPATADNEAMLLEMMQRTTIQTAYKEVENVEPIVENPVIKTENEFTPDFLQEDDEETKMKEIGDFVITIPTWTKACNKTIRFLCENQESDVQYLLNIRLKEGDARFEQQQKLRAYLEYCRK